MEVNLWKANEYLRMYVLEGVKPEELSAEDGVGFIGVKGVKLATIFEQSCPPHPISHTHVLILEQICNSKR